MSRNRLRLLISSLALAPCFFTACAPATDPGNAPGSADEGLGFSEACDAVTPDSTFSGSGSVVSTTTYDHVGCTQGFVVDINGYAPRNDFGTLAAYSGPAPTTSTACTSALVRAFVWRRNADGTRTALGSTSLRGQWVTNFWGEPRCKVPEIRLDRAIAGYTFGGNYRVAMRAQATVSGVITSQKITFATVMKPAPLLPVHLVEHAATSLGRIQGSALFGLTHPALTRVWSVRGTPQAGILCRDFGLKLAFENTTRAVFTRLGASTATVSNRIVKETSIFNLLCNTPNPTAAQQATFNADLAASLALTGDIFRQIATNSGVTADEAAFSAAKLLVGAYDSITSSCSANLSEIANYLHDGSLPAGMLGPNVLMRNCSGGIAGVRSAVSAALGLGGAAVGADYATCMADAFTTQTGICSDPVAQSAEPVDAPPPSTPPPDDDDDSCGPDLECVGAKKKALDLMSQLESLYGDQKRALMALHAVDEDQAAADREAESIISVADEMITLGLEMGGPEGDQEVEDAVDRLTQMMETNRKLNAEIEDRRRQANEDFKDATDALKFLCSPGGTASESGVRSLAKFCPKTARCPGFDFANGSRGWFATQPGPDGDTRALNSYDRVNHCLCLALGGRAPGTCESTADRQKQDCLTNPLGPDDGPRPECVLLMEPAQIDRAAIDARICTLVRCADHDVLMTDLGQCGCATGLGQVGSPLSPRCPAVIDCTEDSVLNEHTCLCQPLNAGAVPFAPPGCPINPAAAPGGLDQWLLSSPDLVNLNQTPLVINGQTQIRNVLTLDPGIVAVGSPWFLTNDVPVLGTSLFTDVLLPEQTGPFGARGVAQVHLSVGNAFNGMVGQTNLAGRPAGVQRLAFNLPAAARTALQAPGNDVRVSFVLDTDPTAPAPTSLVGFGFSGTRLPTPSPTPGCPVTPGAPTSPDFEVIPTNLQSWPFIGL